MNYFSLFDLPICYQIDIQVLTSRFHNLQHIHHPDKFATSSQEEQLAAIKQSAIINQAWQTLRNPLTRAEYLLSLSCLNLAKEGYTISNTGFLMEQLSLREKLHEIEKIKNVLHLREFILRVKKIFDRYHQQMIKEFDGQEWKKAFDTVQKLRFLEKLLISAEQLKEKLLDL